MTDPTVITFAHDDMRPIGKIIVRDGKIVFVLQPEAKITVKDINNVNLAFAPTYSVIKAHNDIVEEVELLGMAVVGNGVPNDD